MARCTGRAASVVLLDIHHLEHINDTWGHATGDGALRRIAQDASEAPGAEDYIRRLSEGEFLMLLPDFDQAAAMVTAQRVRLAIQVGGGDLQVKPFVSVSVGVATWFVEDTADRLLQRAYWVMHKRTQQAPPDCARSTAPIAPWATWRSLHK